MGLPSKRRTSRSKRERAANFGLSKVGATTCPNCKSPKLSHRACPNCGEYRGRKTTKALKKVVKKVRKAKKQ